MATPAETEVERRPAVPDELPVLPLRGLVVYPFAVVPLVVGQERSVRLVDEVMRRDRLLAAVAQEGDRAEPGPDELRRIGTAAMIHQLARARDGSLRLVVQGIERVRIERFTRTEPWLEAAVGKLPESAAAGPETEGLRRAALDLFRRLVAVSEELPDEAQALAEGVPDPLQLAYLLGSLAPLELAERQALLEAEGVDAKLRLLLELLQHQAAVRELGRKITADVEKQLTRAQKEHYLHEQMRAIQRELGEGDETPELRELRDRLARAEMPPAARAEAERELKRLREIPPASAEHGLTRTWLEWMASLPWGRTTGGEIDLARSRGVLDRDHYDLEKVKERILEHLAVRKLRQERSARAAPAAEGAGESREPILCFVGPPGVGKTSLGLSIARALGREFVRIALGGLHDEAEVRGHRRTYVGAMPGRVVQALKQAGSRDPVFMLDEIDKIGSDWRGDPAAALLEVLDPAQNSTFTDNYLGVPFDLSQVLFIATANALDPVAPPLLDRMELLALAGYTEDEKVRIAERYLLPRQRAASGLAEAELELDEGALRRIVSGYTREAGVRGLEREIARVCRKVARRVAEGNGEPARVGAGDVERYLGRPRFVAEVAERTDRPGVATGLAWTPAGGDVLFVEATMMPAREERLTLTGMLGDVMRESAQAALSYVRANALALGVDPALFEGRAIHVHVPAGAIPKDGPSAGVTIVTALASLVSGRLVRDDTAMTGEITLRGKVMPVGGIKEKVLAAHRAGIRTVVLPRRNDRDLEDVPPELRERLEFVLVDTADQALAAALAPAPAAPAAAAAPAPGGAA